MKNKNKVLIINIIFIIIINIITNYNFVISLFNKTNPQKYNNDNLIINNNISFSTYEIQNINKNVNMLEINFNNIPTSITINYTSENNSNYIGYSEYNIKEDKIFIPISINSNIKDLSIISIGGKINSITINPKIEYKLNLFKTIFIYLLTIAFYYIIFKNEKLNNKSKTQEYIILITITSLIIICILLYTQYNIKYPGFGDMYDYYYTNSILNGKLSLDYPIDENLLNSPNPYDITNRNFNFLWDSSFYKGKYYCYFGIWPLISLFIPYKLITSTYLTTKLGCLIYSILSIIGTFIIYNNIIKKYFKNISFQTFIISFLFIIFGSKILWCMYRPSFYELVSLAAYTHTIFGLNLVLFSDKRRNNLIGYTLLALTALCRPTYLLYSILIIPKLIHKIKKKEFKLIDFLIFTTPYLIIGIITMALNYIRYDSIFEFGTSYQLTVNNLTNKQFSIYNCIFGLYHYLFESINIVSLLPLEITETIPKVNYVSELYIENLGGGIIPTSIIGIIIFFTPKILKKIKEKELKTYIILSLFVATSLIILSSSMNALIGRYMLDFNFIFYSISIILSLYIIKIIKNEKIIKLYKIILLISIIINLILLKSNII